MFAMTFPVIDPVAIQMGPLAVRWYALAYLVGFVAGWQYCLSLARLSPGRPQPSDYDDFLTWAVLGVVVGGRLGYVLFYNLPYYAANPLAAAEVWKGGMSFHGGLIGVVVVTLIFCWRRGISPFAFGDLIAAAAPIGLFFGRIANFVNGELYGRAADETVPWAMVFPHDPLQIPRHPSQLYEAALEGLVLFVVLAALVRLPEVRRRPGMISGLFFIGYGLSRIIVEFFREPDAQVGYLLGGATMGQLLCLPMVAFGAWLAARARPVATA